MSVYLAVLSRLVLRNGAERDDKFPLRDRGGSVYRLFRGIVKLVAHFPRSPGQHFVDRLFERLAAQFAGIQEVALRLAVQGSQAVRGQREEGGICPKFEGRADLIGESVKKK